MFWAGLLAIAGLAHAAHVEAPGASLTWWDCLRESPLFLLKEGARPTSPNASHSHMEKVPAFGYSRTMRAAVTTSFGAMAVLLTTTADAFVATATTGAHFAEKGSLLQRERER